MALNLTISSYQRLSPGQSRSKTLEQGRLTLGRAPDNDWVLSDPEMVLSKNHCYIDSRDDGYYITDTSTNGVFINHSEQRLGRGNSAKINDQDVLILGDYEISVHLSNARPDEKPPDEKSPDEKSPDEKSYEAGLNSMGEPTGPEWTDENIMSAPAKPVEPSDFSVAPENNVHNADNAGVDEIALPASMNDEDPLGLGTDLQEDKQEPSLGQYSEPDHLPSDQEFFRPPKAIPDASMAPPQDEQDDQLDSLGLPIMPSQSPAAAPSAIPEDWEDSLIQRLIEKDDRPSAKPSKQAAQPETIQPETIQPEASQPEASQPETAQPSPRPAESQEPEEAQSSEGTPAESSLDPFADLEESASAEPDSFTEQIPVFEASEGAQQAPETAQPPASGAGAKPASARPPATAVYAQAVQALFQGAGMPAVALREAEALELLQKMGQIFRCTAQGMMELLRARGNVKNEFHLERTMVGPIENNPLKILPTVDEAMNAMLLRRDQTWIPADRAISEGFADMRAHELAFMAGMQAALKHLLATFDPVQLERELGQHSAWPNILAGGRKARHWDAFTALYSKIAGKAEDDFQELFRKEFARAYQAQLQKLRQSRES